MSLLPRRIVVLGTGGTIAGSSDDASANVGYTAGTVPVAALLQHVTPPAHITLVTEQVAQLDSKDMDVATWQRLHARCVQWLSEPDVAAVIITHGTDTIEETAFFLRAALHARKPVVLTCAMRPATSRAPDGPQNLRDALAVALHVEARGVLVVAAGEIHGAADVRKVHPYRVNAFASGDAGVLGYVEEGQVRLVRDWPPAEPLLALTAEAIARAAHAWPRVEIVVSHAGTGGGLIELLIRERQDSRTGAADGLVLAATGNGTLHHAIERLAERAHAAGIDVVVATRCADGPMVGVTSSCYYRSSPYSPVKARVALLLRLLALQK